MKLVRQKKLLRHSVLHYRWQYSENVIQPTEQRFWRHSTSGGLCFPIVASSIACKCVIFRINLWRFIQARQSGGISLPSGQAARSTAQGCQEVQARLLDVLQYGVQLSYFCKLVPGWLCTELNIKGLFCIFAQGQKHKFRALTKSPSWSFIKHKCRCQICER